MKISGKEILITRYEIEILFLGFFAFIGGWILDTKFQAPAEISFFTSFVGFCLVLVSACEIIFKLSKGLY